MGSGGLKSSGRQGIRLNKCPKTLSKDLGRRVQRVWDGEQAESFVLRLEMNVQSLPDEERKGFGMKKRSSSITYKSLGMKGAKSLGSRTGQRFCSKTLEEGSKSLFWDEV